MIELRNLNKTFLTQAGSIVIQSINPFIFPDVMVMK